MLRALGENHPTPDGSGSSSQAVSPSLRHLQLQYLPWYEDYMSTLLESLRRRKTLGADDLDILDIEFLVREEDKAKCEQSLSCHDDELRSLVRDLRHELELV